MNDNIYLITSIQAAIRAGTAILEVYRSTEFEIEKKADKSPEEVGLKLLNRPKRPGFTTLYKNYLDEYSPEEWTDYIIGV